MAAPTKKAPRKKAPAKKPPRRPSRPLSGLPEVRPGSAAADRLDNVKVDLLKVGVLTAAGSLLVAGLFMAKGAINKVIVEAKEEKASTQVATLFSPSYWADRLRAALPQRH